MSSATVAAADATTTPPTTTKPPPPSAPLTSFTCRVCQQTFEDSASQRKHFKTDEHVASVKRQLRLELEAEPGRGISSLSLGESTDATATRGETADGNEDKSLDPQPSLSTTDEKALSRRGKDPARQSHATASTALSPSGDTSSENDDTDSPFPTFDPAACLFCAHRSSDNDPDSGFSDSLAHMQTAHGLSIPHQDRLIDLESFISYLFLVIFEFNECIHCGITKGSARDVQRHMLTKQHCGIEEPERNSEYRDFYDFSNSDQEDEDESGAADAEDVVESQLTSLVNSEETFVRLPSGKMLGHRSTARSSRKDGLQQTHPGPSSIRQTVTPIGNDNNNNNNNNNSELANVEQADPPPPKAGTRQLIVRKNDEKGLVGVPEWQRRMIRATEVKMQKVEIRKRNRYEAAVQRAADERPDLRKRRTTRVPDSV